MNFCQHVPVPTGSGTPCPMQCLAPWLDGLTDPAQLKADIVALGSSLTTGLATALSAVSDDVGELAVS